MSLDLLDLLDEILAAEQTPKDRPRTGMHQCGRHRLISEDDAHVADCWNHVCPSCGDEVHNGFLMRINHEGSDARTCPSIILRAAHLVYAQRTGEAPAARDLTILDLGYRIADDGTLIHPERTPA